MALSHIGEVVTEATLLVRAITGDKHVHVDRWLYLINESIISHSQVRHEDSSWLRLEIEVRDFLFAASVAEGKPPFSLAVLDDNFSTENKCCARYCYGT